MTAAHLNELLEYEPETGTLRWKVKHKRVSPGDIAGYATARGYRGIRIGGREFKAHRVAWCIHHGEWPKGDIDHINGDKADNRIVNVRDVSRAVNMQNKRVARADSQTGVLGVNKCRSGFRALIQLNGKRRTLGTFPTAEQAHAAYLTAKRAIHEGNTL